MPAAVASAAALVDCLATGRLGRGIPGGAEPDTTWCWRVRAYLVRQPGQEAVRGSKTRDRLGCSSMRTRVFGASLAGIDFPR
jgi:hypothetical protein